METVDLQQVLAARDRRVQLQQQLLAAWQRPLICFTMNIAGPVKNSPLIQRGFRLGIRRLEQQLLRLRYPVLHREQRCGPTGCEAFYVVDSPARVLKDMTIDLEEADALGRLLDLDVIDETGCKMERSGQRGCLICGAAGRACARSRAHTVETLQAKTTEILTGALYRHEQQQAAELACRALLYEACTTPKPGLVDRLGSGSHEDMDLFTFLSSSAALTPYFETCTRLGQETAQLPPEETFRQLRRPGRLAEGAMLQATGGVNTHKGAVFILGLLCGALGRLGQPQWQNTDRILAECAAMTRGLTESELGGTPAEAATAGQRFYSSHRIRGIRGEAEAGFPSVCRNGLPVLRQALAEGCTLEEAGCRALLGLMAATEDTALMHRGGMDSWRQIQQAAAGLLRSGVTTEALLQLDREMTAKHLSPGGSADLLALCYLLYFLTTADPYETDEGKSQF